MTELPEGFDPFVSRARTLSRAANGIIFFIFILIAIGGVVFYFAASIARSDASDGYEYKQKEISKRILQLETDQTALNAKVSEITIQSNGDINAVCDKWQKKYTQHSRLPLGGYTSFRIEYRTLNNDDALRAFQSFAASAPIIPADDTNKKGVDVKVKYFDCSNGFLLRTIGIPETEAASFAAEIVNIVNNRDRDRQIKTFEADIRKNSEESKLYKNAAEAVDRRRADIVAGLASPDATSAQSDHIFLVNLIQTNITRFGTLAILLFLVSLLISLYRYNVRLAAFYSARSDALLLYRSKQLKADFGSLVSNLTPGVDFGRSPSTPIEQVIELVKAASNVKTENMDGKSS